ncbi:MAG: bifunctional pyr operon transcriptional regulator/uracil phosphoribosyltransferase PyrR [Planctomycetes bacterium]|nr:bifunctional pyr operon transcriptional regulator/uracil phosphoribosyltransferase PyrR [Planctomycetota bacterium]
MTKSRKDAAWVKATLERLAQEILAATANESALVVVGIRTRGSVLAERLAASLQTAGREIAIGHVDVTLYRDDINNGGGRKAIGASDMPYNPEGKTIILVDDVLSTGRTVRAAITEIMDFGRPARILLLAFIDRGGRELPIQPDFTGETLKVAVDKKLQLRVKEIDGEDAVEEE